MAVGLFVGVAAATAGCGFFPPLNQTTTCTASATCTSAVSYMYALNENTSAAAVAGLALTTTTDTSTSPSTVTLTVKGTPGDNYALNFVPNAMAITPNHSFLYVSSLTGGINIYAINSDYSISLQTAISPSPAASGTLPRSMVVDPNGNWLLVLTQSIATTQASIDVFSIDATTGALTLAQSVTVQNAGVSQQIAIAPSETVIAPNSTTSLGLVAVTLGAGGLETYTFDSTSGALTFAGHKASGATLYQDIGLTIDPESKYIFETETVASAVRVFTINTTTGGFTEVAGSPYTVGTGPSAVLVSSDSSHVYVANQSSNNISGFTLGTGGALTAISGSPFATGTTPVGLVEDSTHTYIGAVCQGGNPDVQLFTIDTTTPGKLDSANKVTTGTSSAAASAGAIVAVQ
jgi:6-phosphogluconolactonase (cycloisomerase 2 family)